MKRAILRKRNLEQPEGLDGVWVVGQNVQTCASLQQMQSAFSCDSHTPGVNKFHTAEATLHTRLEQHFSAGTEWNGG